MHSLFNIEIPPGESMTATSVGHFRPERLKLRGLAHSQHPSPPRHNTQKLRQNIEHPQGNAMDEIKSIMAAPSITSDYIPTDAVAVITEPINTTVVHTINSADADSDSIVEEHVMAIVRFNREDGVDTDWALLEDTMIQVSSDLALLAFCDGILTAKQALEAAAGTKTGNEILSIWTPYLTLGPSTATNLLAIVKLNRTILISSRKPLQLTNPAAQDPAALPWHFEVHLRAHIIKSFQFFHPKVGSDENIATAFNSALNACFGSHDGEDYLKRFERMEVVWGQGPGGEVLRHRIIEADEGNPGEMEMWARVCRRGTKVIAWGRESVLHLEAAERAWKRS